MFVFGVVCHRITNPFLFTVKKLAEGKLNTVIVHADLKMDESDFNKIQDEFIGYENIIFLDYDRIDVRWGGFSQIEVIILLLRKASKLNFKYFSLISGDDLILLDNNGLECFLSESYSRNVEFIGNCSTHDAIERLKYNYPAYFFTKDKKILNKFKIIFYKYFLKFFKINSFYKDLPELYKGCNWFTITDKSVSYLLSFIDSNPRYTEAFKYSLCADEVYFQTIIFNSKFRGSIYQNGKDKSDCEMSLRFIDWNTGPEYPKILDEKDKYKIIESNAIFARKINPNISLYQLEIMFNSIVSKKKIKL